MADYKVTIRREWSTDHETVLAAGRIEAGGPVGAAIKALHLFLPERDAGTAAPLTLRVEAD